ncbi:MAG TPA: transporter [Roseimicrobium sp.]|nr:transporter [Roseimicrobium sp.]
MRSFNRLSILVIAGCAAANLSVGAADAPDKSQFTLLNPTPRELMRKLSTDRPDLTESPYTVDAGHFQFETDLLNYTYDRYNSARSNTRDEALSVSTINAKVGLWNNVDLQLVVPVYNRVRSRDLTTGAVTKGDGFGDLITRLKVNLWGNDGGTTAFGVMPFIKIPTAASGLGNGSVEGGIILPLAVELPAGWGMGTMLEVDVIRNGAGSGQHAEVVQTVTFAHDILGSLGGYVEFFSLLSTESGAGWVASVNAGLTYGLTTDIQLDCGIKVGVTRAAPDLNPFVGITFRF